jgi:nitronate monooxygenase
VLHFDIAAVIAGEAVNLIHDIPPAGDVVRRIVREAETMLDGRLNSFAIERT